MTKAEIEKEIIQAIYHKNVLDFFESLGLSEELANGKIRCSFCNEIITQDNFRAVTRKAGNLLFCCDNKSCIQRLELCLRGDK